MDNNKHPGGSMKQPLGETPTRSQLIPLQTNWRSVMGKGYFWPGVITVAALWGPFDRETLAAANPDHFIGCLPDLPAVLERAFGA